MDHPRPGLRYVDADDLDNSSFNFDGIAVVDPAGEKLGDVDGFIINVNNGRPYHVVVKAGHWYKHKYFLLPVGHAALDRTAKRLEADVSQERVERFPGFSLSEFEQLTDAEMDEMLTSAVCCDEPVDTTISWETWAHYEYPTWWDASYYRPDRAGDEGRRPAGTAESTKSRG